MKRFILVFSLITITFLGARAQETSNVVLFSQNGEQFTAILNGLRMNEAPQTNIKITDLNQAAYKLKIIFANRALGEMDKNLYTKPGFEVVMNIKQNKKGEYKLRYFSEAPLAQVGPPVVDQKVVVFNANLPAATSTVTVVEETHTTTSTGGSGSPTGENVTMNVNIDGFNMGVNVNTSETGGSMHSSTSSTSMTTTTTSTGGWTGETAADPQMDGTPCYEMAPNDFTEAKSSVSSKAFADSRMTLAKQITKNNCLSSSQVKQLAKIFDFEDDKLSYAKFAYNYVIDPANYYKVNDAFEFESSIEELDDYIEGQR